MDAVKTAVGDLVPRVQAGGRKARTALIRLISLATEPNAKTIMQVAGVPNAAARLMKSSSSSVELQRLAGSLLTLISGMPVTSEISDDLTGSYGNVNIVLPRPSRIYAPDQTLMDISAGQ